MNLYFYDLDKVITFELPSVKIGNFWLADLSGKNMVNINGENDNWVLTGNDNVNVIGNVFNGKTVLKENTYYVVTKDEVKKLIYAGSLNDRSFKCYGVNEGELITFGRSNECDVCFKNPYLSNNHFSIKYENNNWFISRDKTSNIYCDGNIVNEENKCVSNGTIIDIYGYRIVLSNKMIFINNPCNEVTINNKLSLINIDSGNVDDTEIESEELYKDNDYFLKSPRMRKFITTFDLSIDSPPEKVNIPETPLFLTLCPMLTMGASSIITITNTFQNISNKTSTLRESIPALAVSLLLIILMLAWPLINKKHEKNKIIKSNNERTNRYKNYINSKNNELNDEFNNQKKIIEDNLIPLNTCYDIITNKRRTLWERKIDQDDFLTIRLGIGSIPFNANIRYQSSDFKIDDDELKELASNLVNKYKNIDNVPIGYSFLNKKLTALCGMYPKYIDFMNNVFLQLMAYHSYDNLKIVILTNKNNSSRWNYLKETPYCFSSDKSIRFYASSAEEMIDVSSYLEKIYNSRKEVITNEKVNYSEHYLVLTDDVDLSRKINIVDTILKDKINLGFSLIVVEEKLSKIPSEVSEFITIGDNASAVISTTNNEQIKFKDEINNSFDMNLCASILSNLPIYNLDNSKDIKDTVTFLEMFGVGKVSQLNVLNRWKNNDPTKSLRTEVGLNENNDLFMLDIHEKAHGPHGLIAGMTGSGKSEFIITMILSMAVNYSPLEVNFVLIDYKGGGLAGAFERENKKLPHVVGTITNLDKSEINRALSSIKSELKRRQNIFNETKKLLGESTLDIYKYQKLFRDGIIKEAMPHLIIVCDEFAELKSGQPEFMDDLVSTARIGRSLGVHLILATQKPSGVVDAQIWSNARFKVCLKVQDKQDSMEMIKNDLAANLKQTGRFYLQVGYNELFELGQSAYSGAQYYPSKEYKKLEDKNLYFIDNTGFINKTITNSSRKNIISEGEEVKNVVDYLIDTAYSSKLNIKPLWLDKIPSKVLIDSIAKKYNYKKSSYILNPIIGEYDDPDNQSQGVLTLPITSEGNSVIFGSADSGKDMFCESLVYSLLSTYDTNELNMYILDFGAETLKNFSDAPQIGDIVINGEDEKVLNLVKMLNSELSIRKKAFINYNGNYQDYIKYSGKSLPNILILINSIEVLDEAYQDYSLSISSLVREGVKYGIYFVILTTGMNTIKFKLSQSCKNKICLQMNNSNDYREILGKTDGLVPSNYLGRGLIKLENLCEFQTVSISNNETNMNAIKSLINELNNSNLSKAESIPVMPSVIKFDLFNNRYNGIDSIPLGLVQESLNVKTYNFSKEVINIISSSEMDNTKSFMKNFIHGLTLNNSFNKVIIDASNYFDSCPLKYFNNNFNEVVNMLKRLDDKINEVLSNNNYNRNVLNNIPNYLCIIVGFDKFINKLDDESKSKLFDIFKNNKDNLKINFIFVDTPSNLKKYEYDEWFKNNINTNNGIWVGSNITQQYLIKLGMQLTKLSDISNEYGIVVLDGKPTIIKLINEEK